MLKNTTGIKNVAVGTYAMCAATDGDYNAIVGYQANRLLTTGCYNTTHGYVAGYDNTTGDYNTSIGSSALCNNEDGDNNVALGRAAGAFTDTGSGAVCSPDKGTYIGGCTRASQATPLNETVIGFCACGCGNNSVSIGNCDVGAIYLNTTGCVIANAFAKVGGSSSEFLKADGSVDSCSYTTCTGTTTPSNSQTFTNKGGNISQWTNDCGYTTCAGSVTPSSCDTFTNKSGNISMWTNDCGYTTCTGTTARNS